MGLNLTVMKQTADNVFLDSNILIYCYTNTELDKQQKVFQVIDNNIDTVRKANAVKNKYGYSFYDSLIVAAALECGCVTLFSEDMQHGQTIEVV